MSNHRLGQGPYNSGRPRQSHPSLSVNTSTPHHGRSPPHHHHQTPLSASSDVPTPHYPLPIPPEKQERALKLYTDYQSAELEEGLVQRGNDPVSAIDGYLSVPGHSVTMSTSSVGSPRHRNTPSVSTYDPTEMSSVMSFEPDESPSSATLEQKELKTYHGQTVKQRSRKRLAPKAKAKAALIRYLGSCPACRKRAVSCPLEHYDMKILDRLHQHKLSNTKNEVRPQPDKFPSSSSTTSRKHQRPLPDAQKLNRKHRRSVSREQVAPPPSQSDALFLGLGQGQSEGYDQRLRPNPQAYISELNMDLGEGVDENLLSPAPLYQAAQTLPTITQDAYSQQDNATMVLIGDIRSRSYHCRHDGCDLLFQKIEELQLHFEGNHLPVSRLEQPLRVRCTSCEYVGNHMADSQCRQCGDSSQFELCVYGQLIYSASHGRYSSDEQDFFQYTPTTTSQYAPSYESPSINLYNGPSMTTDSFQQDQYDGSFDYEFNQQFIGSEHQTLHTPALSYVDDRDGSFREETFSQERDPSAIPSAGWPSVHNANGYGASGGVYDNLNS
ncbi:hypothetical protein GLAREA_02846 [Glarea lozoyensis ATCC 20868]|uniref:C2H2-type domain-containing protein n=1 Tax=Glarea lozoyensis (strain ATCC 20868 / MF5171) TaxID=1116229 RepID=S3CK92_GLAL2|nr:uncharacterized protein GLAREA_02846 [Glarea lozoyensis ATCC 20868]EPE26932.1 hypothetical protein GLAREA_02846 [Glarea lozoyensis ATCC 20868]